MKKHITISAIASFLLPIATYAATVTDPGTSLTACKTISQYGIAGVVGCLIGVMNNALYLIMAASVLYVVWGAFQLMKEEKREEAKNTVLYGIIGLFVMISIWGLVNILDRTFNLTGPAKTPPALTPFGNAKTTTQTSSLQGPIE